MQNFYFSHTASRGMAWPGASARSLALAFMALVVGFFVSVGPAVANSAAGLPDFVNIVEASEKAVVNIRTTSTVSTAQAGGRDPMEMFRWFFGPDFQGPGVPPPAQRRGNPGNPPGNAETPQERTVPRGVGSGFFISDDGAILTNHHVIEGASEIFVTMTDGREFKATVVGSDQRTDVALIKIDLSGTPSLPIGSAKNLKKGQWVLAIGSPFGLESTVTAGIVSAIGRETGDYLPFIQTDVAVNPGNSGGPLLNLDGQVVGINAQIVSRSGGFMGISLAIPIDEAMEVVGQLRAEGRVTRGRIGVQIGEVSQDVAQASGLEDTKGAMVSRVMPDGPAQAAGVQPGDIVLSFNGRKIEKWSDLPRIVGQIKPGTKSKMEVWRKGKRVTLDITVDELPGAQPVASAAPAKPAAPGVTAMGVTVVDLTADERKKLGVAAGGVRVTESAGIGASAGIAIGDVILTVGNTDITSAEQFVKLVESATKDKPVGMMIQREGQTQWVLVRPQKS